MNINRIDRIKSLLQTILLLLALIISIAVIIMINQKNFDFNNAMTVVSLQSCVLAFLVVLNGALLINPFREGQPKTTEKTSK